MRKPQAEKRNVARQSMSVERRELTRRETEESKKGMDPNFSGDEEERTYRRFRLPTWLALTALVGLILGFVYLLHWVFTRKTSSSPSPGRGGSSPSSTLSPSGPPENPTFQVISVASSCYNALNVSQISFSANGSVVFSAAPPAGSTGGLLVAKLPSPQGVRPNELVGFFQRTAQVRYFQDSTADAQDVLTLVQFVRTAFSDGTHFLAVAVDRASPKLLNNVVVASALIWSKLVSNPIPTGALTSFAFPETDYATFEDDACRSEISVSAIGPSVSTPSPSSTT